MELNHLPSGYEPDEIPFLHSAIAINQFLAGEPGFEPGQTESKSGVLPLDDSPMYWQLVTAEEGTRTLKP